MGKFPKLTNEDLKNYPKTKMKKEWEGSPFAEILN